MNSIQIGGCAALLITATIAGAAAMTGSPQAERPRQDSNAGDYLYKVYCRPCHGDSGKGDGPAAKIILDKPADLTTIAKRRGGVFPREEMIRIVDGRQMIESHRRDMPKWGTMLQPIEDRDEALIRRRIEAMVDYLQSLQTPPD